MKIKFALYSALLLVMAFFVVSCPNPVGNVISQSGPAILSVSISPRIIQVQRGTDEQFNAEVKTRGVIDTAVTWELEGSQHSGTKLSDAGLLSVDSDEAARILTVKAVSVKNQQIWAFATIALSDDPVPIYTVTVTGGAASKTDYKVGQTVTINASIQADMSFTQWFTESQGVSIADSHSAITSFVMPKNDVSINAMFEYIPTVTVLSIKPDKTTVQVGTTKQFRATVEGLGNFDDSIIWELEGNSHNTTSIDTNGLLTVAAGEAPSIATVKVRAVSKVNPLKFAEAQVSISKDPPPKPEIISVSISPKKSNVALGGTLQFKATVKAVGDSDEAIIWTLSGNSSNETKIDGDGRLTVALDEETDIELTVKAASADDNDKFAEATVTTKKQSVFTSITIEPSEATVKLGETKQFKAVLVVSEDVDKSVNWSITGNSSENTTISEDGLLTVASDEASNHELTVKATSLAYPGESAEVTVHIPVPLITGITVSPSEAFTLKRGLTHQFTATVSGETGFNGRVNWSISGKTSAGTKIDPSGLLTIATNESSGGLTITAKSAQNSRIYETVRVYPGYKVTIELLHGKSETLSVKVVKSDQRVQIDAPTPPDTHDAYNTYIFTGWSSSSGISFTDSESISTNFIMPRKDVTVTAKYRPGGYVHIHPHKLSYYNQTIPGAYYNEGNHSLTITDLNRAS